MQPLSSGRLKMLDFSQIPALYIHVPFCRKKCNYCDFFSVVPTAPEEISVVLEELKRQITWFYNTGVSNALQTIFIGGGTPSILPPEKLEALLQSAGNSHPDKLLEYSCEMNPESCTLDGLTILKEQGVSRISLGVQSFNDKVLKTSGRLTTRAMNIRALELCRETWNGDLNLDLISGLPHQDYHVLDTDLQTALTFQPEHFSLYALSVEPDTPIEAQIEAGKVSLLDSAVRDHSWRQGCINLKQAGYTHYEISNFARTGKACLHNLHYWNLNPYLGLGPGAVSTLPGKNNEIVRLYNPVNLASYLQGKQGTWGMEWESISTKEFLYENLMMGLRLKEGIKRESFLKRFGMEAHALLPRTFKSWLKRGIVQETEFSFSLQGKHRFFLNTYLLEVLAEIESIPESNITLNWQGF